MKKRILALALACLMLVSMFPTAIFAADATCPGKGNLHTKANIANAWVKEVVEPGTPTVCEGGYTLYVCNECDTPFMIDTNPDTHDYKSAANVDPKCNEDGKKNREVCSICGDEKFEVWEKGPEHHGWKKIDGQFYKDETPLWRCEYCGDEKGTTPAECDNISDTTGFHEWVGVTPEILVAPTATADGKAKFTCAECKYSEEVKIHNHKLTKVEYKAPSCINEGNQEYYTCDVTGCVGKYYLTEALANQFVTADYNTQIKINADRPEHDWDVTNFTAYTPSNCKTKTAESWMMWCSECEGYFTRTGEIQHSAAENFCVDATCFNNGAHYYYCADCNTKFADADCADKPTDKITANHTAGTPNLNGKLDASLASFLKIDGKQYACWKVESAVKAGTDDAATNRTCTEGLKVTVSCSKCNATHEFNIPATKHNIVTVTVDATCTTLGFTYDKCTNDNCPTMLASAGTINAEITTKLSQLDAPYNSYTNTALYRDELTDSADVRMVLDTVSGYIPGSVVIDAEGGINTSNHIKNETLTNAPTCTAKGTKNWNCIFCSASDTGVTVKENGHDMGAAVTYDAVDAVSGRHYTYTVKTCKTQGCNAGENGGVYTETSENKYYDLKPIYDSLEASIEAHHVYDGNGLNDVRDADCALGIAALQSYVCDECNKTITVKVPNSEYHLIDGSKCDCAFCDEYDGEYYTGDVKKANYVKPTCTRDGFWDVFHCANAYCKTYNVDNKIAEIAVVIDTDSKLGHDFSTVKVTAEASGCKKDGTLAVYACKNGCGAYLTNTHIHDAGTDEQNLESAKAEAIVAARDPKWHSNANNFTYYEAVPADCYSAGTKAYYQCKHCGNKYENVGDSGVLDIVDPKKSHSFAIVQDVPVICALNQFAFKHYNCTRSGCDEEYIVAYVPAPIHSKGDKIEAEKVTMNLATFEADANGTEVNTYLAPTCTLNGYQFYECAVTEGCYYIEYIDALGHINRNGVNLSDCKNNDETIRDCVRCRVNDIEVNEGHMNWVPVYDEIWNPEYNSADAEYKTFYVRGEKDATCTEDGWDAYVCSHCKYKDEERTEVFGAHGHSFGSKKWDADKNTWYQLCTRANCNERKDVDGDGIALSMTASNALVNGAVYTDASTIKLTVKASGMPAASVSGIQFTVDFDSTEVAFANVKAVGSSFQITTAKVNEDNANKVTAVLLSAGTVELGTTETAVVELYFTVKTAAETEITFSINHSDEDKVVATSANATNTYHVAANAAGVVAKVSVETEKLMDCDGNNTVDVHDLVALYNLTKKTDAAAAYTSVGDVDRDGKLTLTDLQIIADYIAAGANVSTDAYLKIVGRYVAS